MVIPSSAQELFLALSSVLKGTICNTKDSNRVVAMQPYESVLPPLHPVSVLFVGLQLKVLGDRVMPESTLGLQHTKPIYTPV